MVAATMEAVAAAVTMTAAARAAAAAKPGTAAKPAAAAKPVKSLEATAVEEVGVAAKAAKMVGTVVARRLAWRRNPPRTQVEADLIRRTRATPGGCDRLR